MYDLFSCASSPPGKVNNMKSVKIGMDMSSFQFDKIDDLITLENKSYDM